MPNWAGSSYDRRSTSGYYIKLGGNMIVWKIKKQAVITRSSAEAEYRAVAKVTTEFLWIDLLLGELGFQISVPMNLWCDNQAVANNLVLHERTKLQTYVSCSGILFKTRLNKDNLFGAHHFG